MPSLFTHVHHNFGFFFFVTRNFFADLRGVIGETEWTYLDRYLILRLETPLTDKRKEVADSFAFFLRCLRQCEADALSRKYSSGYFRHTTPHFREKKKLTSRLRGLIYHTHQFVRNRWTKRMKNYDAERVAFLKRARIRIRTRIYILYIKCNNMLIVYCNNLLTTIISYGQNNVPQIVEARVSRT